MKMAKPILERIEEHYTIGISYFELRRLVFPEDEFPNAWRRSSNGGPVGCSMAFGAALRRSNMYRDPKDRIYKRSK